MAPSFEEQKQQMHLTVDVNAYIDEAKQVRRTKHNSLNRSAQALI